MTIDKLTIAQRKWKEKVEELIAVQSQIDIPSEKIDLLQRRLAGILSASSPYYGEISYREKSDNLGIEVRYKYDREKE